MPSRRRSAASTLTPGIDERTRDGSVSSELRAVEVGRDREARQLEVGTAKRSKQRRLDPEHRDAGDVGKPCDVPRRAEHRRCDDPRPEPLQPLRRRDLADRNEPGEILAQHEVGAERERRLVAPALLERRAVGAGEHREADADDEKRHRRRPGARPSRDREQREARGQPAIGQGARNEQDEPRQHTRGDDPHDRDDGDGEGDQERAAATAAQHLLGVGRSARERRGDRQRKTRGDHVQRAETSGLVGVGHERADDRDGRGKREQCHREHAAGREQRMSCELSFADRRSRERRCDPCERDTDHRQEDGLRRHDETALPQRHAEQRQPPVRSL